MPPPGRGFFRSGPSLRRVLEWSFYSQGTEDRVTSADRFLDHALAWFGEPDFKAAPWDRGLRLAELVRREKTLLVLDGIEPLQHPPGPLAGRLKDPGLAALLKGLAGDNPGLCVVTTRERITDLDRFPKTAPQENLEALSPEAGAELLRNLGVKGRESELQAASKEFGSHALTLTLLGTYLKDICHGDIRRCHEVPILEEETDETGHARRVIASYAEALETPEVEVLRLLGLFDRPAEPARLKALRAEPPIPDLTETIGISQEARFRKAVALPRPLPPAAANPGSGALAVWREKLEFLLEQEPRLRGPPRSSPCASRSKRPGRRSRSSGQADKCRSGA